MNTKKNVILIIDDNEQNQYTFGRYLRMSNFEIWSATTGEEGLKLANKNPSLIVLDIQLPDTTGYELCKILKSQPKTASIPILHTSATFTESSDKVIGLEGGADGYLTQPIDAHELSATVQALLRIRTAEQKARHLAVQWQTTFDSVRDGICLVNGAGNIERFNRPFKALFLNPERVQQGVDFNSVLSELYSDNDRPVELPILFELSIQNRWYRITQDSIRDELGDLLGTAWVFSDIHSLREAELKLQRLNQELEQRVAQRTASLKAAMAQMEEFSYAVSHDLRAPLRAMLGYSQALLEDHAATLAPEAADYLERIANRASRLDKMIVDVLTFTRVSQSGLALSPVSLRSVVGDVIEHYPGLKPPHSKITINVNHSVLANESALVQALSNLLINAVKFVKPGTLPEIYIWSEEKGSNIRVWIEDNGIGILPQHQQRLFGMFERLSTNEEYEGNGMGLAIVRKVIERMNGRVGVESDGSNGSKFWIELPDVSEPA